MPRRKRPRAAAATIVAPIAIAFIINGPAASAVGPTPTAVAQPLASALPSVPRHVTAAPGNGFANVHWAAPASSGSAPLTGYVVTAYTGGHSVRSKTVGKVGTARIDGLKNARGYSFHVAARNAKGRGKPAVSTAITIGTPTMPTAVKVTRGERKAILRWRAPTSANGSKVTGYVVVPYLDGRAQAARSLSSTQTKAVITGLAVGRSYRFAIGARNARGVGPRSPHSSVVNPTSKLRADAPPRAGGWFLTRPVGAALPTEATCDARVRYSPWEPRPQNNAANHKIPSKRVTIRKHPAYNATWQAKYRPRVTGNFTGTTDEIIQWAACKWGLSDEILRAQAVDESHWHMRTEGDFEPRSRGHCTLGDQRDPCPTSFGILQIKWYFNPDTNAANNSYPMSKHMTAFSLDYAGAKLRGCYQGWTYFGAESRGDLWGCLGAWYSGEWYDSNAQAYIARVKAHYNAKPWRQW